MTGELIPIAARTTGDWLRSVLSDGADLHADSRAITRGDGFLAWPGERSDGRAHIPEAIRRGAAAVVFDEAGGFTCPDDTVPARALPSLRRVAGPIASQYYGRPSERLDVIAVTGTNGKTSCTQWLASGLASGGRRSAVIGTLGSGVVGELVSFGLTTPDAVALQRMFAGFVSRQVSAVAIEASSIGLDQGRLDGTRVTVGVFTNLTRDHLDYHHTMDAYAQAKARLFTWPRLRAAVINTDDPSAAIMLDAAARDAAARDADETVPAPRRVGFALGPVDRSLRLDARLIGESVEATGDGLRMTIGGDYGRARVGLRLLGRFNASNALAVAAAWLESGVAFDDAMALLETLAPVSGRMQQIDRPARPLAVIDYAHSPDALDSVLATLRPVAAARGGRLWCVFGCGGDRDPGKRPQMGAIAGRLADRVVITSDNPRSEAPEAIIAQIAAGLGTTPHQIEPDRARAIEQALAAADPADVVLIAGKGHEDYQEIAGVRTPFSDAAVASAALARERGGAGV